MKVGDYVRVTETNTPAKIVDVFKAGIIVEFAHNKMTMFYTVKEVRKIQQWK